MDKQPPRMRRQSVRTRVPDLSTSPVAPGEEQQPRELSHPELQAPTKSSLSQSGEPMPQTAIPEQIEITQQQTTDKLPQIKRSKLGYSIRDDLIKKCKQIALEEIGRASCRERV